MAEFIYAGDAGAFKVCTKCQEVIANAKFRNTKKGSFGTHCQCRECDARYSKEWYASNKDAAKDRWEKYYEKNSEVIKEWNRKYRSENPERQRQASLNWLENNREYALESKRLRRLKDPIATRATYRSDNMKRRSTPRGRLEHTIRSGVVSTIKSSAKLGRKTFDLLGYTPQDLMDHLERLFEDGMHWGNHGRGASFWHIDHIIPLSAFNYETPDHIDFKRAWALSNLRPLWEKDNLAKGGRLSSAFQPSLAL